MKTLTNMLLVLVIPFTYAWAFRELFLDRPLFVTEYLSITAIWCATVITIAFAVRIGILVQK